MHPGDSALSVFLFPQARGAKDPWCRLFARLSLASLPRGGGDGDAIRMGILNIMREHGIREGHRPVSTVSVGYVALPNSQDRVLRSVQRIAAARLWGPVTLTGDTQPDPRPQLWCPVLPTPRALSATSWSSGIRNSIRSERAVLE